MDIRLFLSISSGILWTIVYVDSIRIGFKDKSFAMPLWALGLNVTWEFLHFAVPLQAGELSAQAIINGVWFFFDVGILYTYFRYGKKYFPKNIKSHWFYIWGILVLVTSLAVQIAFLVEFTPVRIAATYSAYVQNLVMSVLYISMLVKRGSSEGQTLPIAISKFLGTLAPTIMIGFLGMGPVTEPNMFVIIFGIFIVIFDVGYIYMLAQTKALEKSGEVSNVLI